MNVKEIKPFSLTKRQKIYGISLVIVAVKLMDTRDHDLRN